MKICGFYLDFRARKERILRMGKNGLKASCLII